MTNIINGTEISNKIIEDIKNEVQNYYDSGKGIPGLAIIQIGDKKDSSIYITPLKI